MNKKIILGGLVVLLLITGFFLFGKGDKQAPQVSQEVLADTIEISREYLELRIDTDNVLVNASSYSYDKWNAEMTSILGRWEQLDKNAMELEAEVSEFALLELDFAFVKTASAYTTKEINDIYDKAPPGKKIKTLAKLLGVDAKRAFLILQQTQEESKADAWNEAGDEFKKLENAATVVKDGCKVAGFVGGVVLTGGTAGFAAAGTVAKTAVVVSGADLVLEVSEDAANITFGDDNEISNVVGDVRKITEPAAAILAIADLPKNIATNLDKLNVFVFGADQFRSAVQDGKVIGIKLPAHNKKREEARKIIASVMDPDEIDEWIEENGMSDEDYYADEDEYDEEEYDSAQSASGAADESLTRDSEDKNVDTESGQEITDDKKEENIPDVPIVGRWSGYDIEKPIELNIKADGTCTVISDEYEFATWTSDGANIKFYSPEASVSDYVLFRLSGNSLTFVKIVGLDSDGNIAELAVGDEFFGKVIPAIVLKKE